MQTEILTAKVFAISLVTAQIIRWTALNKRKLRTHCST